MDTLVDQLFAIKDFFLDGILVFPHLLSGFFFFIGLLTSNIGMLILAVGHFNIVPSLSFFANNEWTLFKDGVINFNSLLYSFIPAFMLWFTISGYSWIITWIIPAMYVIKLILPNIMSDIKPTLTLFDAGNPYVWFFGEIKKNPQSTVDLCFMSPEETFTGQDQRRTPSGWLIHILFFVGFVVANAYSIYELPIPSINPSGDPKIDAQNKVSLDKRVKNRKYITGSIIVISVVLLIALIAFRFYMSPCESRFAESLVPMIYCALVGVAWFKVIEVSCGIPASDILGLVQGLINPVAIDNPIVCVGTDSGQS
jgi:hypothetical protein